MESLDQDVRHLSRGRDLDEPHLTILDDLVGEVLPDVDVLGTFPAADDVLPHSMHAVLSSYTGVGFFCANPRRCRSALRYKTSQPAIDAE